MTSRMSGRMNLGRGIALRVPATSANLGAGFDSLGLALALYDDVKVRSTATSGIDVVVRGEGADSLPTDGRHLTAHVITEILRRHDLAVPGLRITAQNRIPQRRGLGSSAAAIVAGVAIAHHLMFDGELNRDAMLRDAAEFEGHPDNVAACIFGGLTVSWSEADGFRTTMLRPAEGIAAVVAIPSSPASTAKARTLLPKEVSLSDAVFNISHAALTVAAISSAPELLPSALNDRLHETARRRAMPHSYRLVTALREHGLAAAISGAGSSVLVLHDGTAPQRVARSVRALATDDFVVRHLAIDCGGVTQR